MGMSGDVSVLVQSVLANTDDYTEEEVLELDPWDLKDLADKIIEDEVIDSGRWTVYKRAVVQYGGKFFAIDYGVGATEMQENDEDFEVSQVYPKAVTKIVYE